MYALGSKPASAKALRSAIADQPPARRATDLRSASLKLQGALSAPRDLKQAQAAK